MLGELKESHNYAMSPQRRFEVFARQQARVGLRFQRVDERWVVTEVATGSPAEAAGVTPGWLVNARDGVPLEHGLGGRLQPGQSVAYDFVDHKDELRELSMKAKILSTADRTEIRTFADGVVYLRFDGFDTKSLRWLRGQLKSNRHAPGVVVDLRHNHGGMFFSLEFMLGEFFPKSVNLGSFIRRNGRHNEKDTAQLRSARYGGRVVILVDETTASCAEIFAHAMRHYGRAVIVGRKTAGAVVVSKFYSLPGGGAIQLAVDDFRAIGGVRLEGVGVVPDRVVPPTLANLRSGRDADLEAALAELRAPAAAAAAKL
jgi:carboxyl-terminal processing protease